MNCLKFPAAVLFCSLLLGCGEVREERLLGAVTSLGETFSFRFSSDRQDFWELRLAPGEFSTIEEKWRVAIRVKNLGSRDLMSPTKENIQEFVGPGESRVVFEGQFRDLLSRRKILRFRATEENSIDIKAEVVVSSPDASGPVSIPFFMVYEDLPL